jgi:ABC-type nickel/cobalt efflux system permease component RcnA
MPYGLLLVVTVAAVGVLHTLVPDHWGPIVVIGRQQGWSRLQTARAAAFAGLGHVTSTLALGLVLWGLGASVASRFGQTVNVVAAAALIAFGLWIAYGGWREARSAGDHAHAAHAHLHRHGDGTEHVHLHEHHDLHVTPSGAAVMHEHAHAIAGRTALVLILGSSPMFEGLPAFLAASTHGAGLVATMAVVFAISTMLTYVITSVAGIAGLQRVSLGPIERYGEMLSGLVVALVGVYSLVTL